MKMHFERCILEDWVGTFYWVTWKFALVFLTILKCIYVVLGNRSGQSDLTPRCLSTGIYTVLLFWLFTSTHILSHMKCIENSKKLPVHPFIVSCKGLVTVQVQAIAQIPDFCDHFLICNKFVPQVAPSVPFAMCLWQFPWDCMKCCVVCKNCCSLGHGRGPWHFFRVLFWPQRNEEFLAGVALVPPDMFETFHLRQTSLWQFLFWRTNWTVYLFTTLTVLIQIILAVVAWFLKRFNTMWSRVT